MSTIDTGIYTHDGIPLQELLWDLVNIAAAGLTQTPQGIPDLIGFYHSMPPEDCPSSLFLWVREWVPIAKGQYPQQAAEPPTCPNPILFMPRVVLSLRRPCAPIPGAQGEIDFEAEALAARDLIVDARALTCAVAADWPARLAQLYPAARLHYDAMTAEGAGTNVFGWDLGVLLEIDGCRAACSP
ncbi:MAG TPA: hypothetical protein PKL08_14895 [Thermoanaerobaculaceae bacterium]|nr:hypothetical protein [Thermoanaerobaculaceae bacterium]